MPFKTQSYHYIYIYYIYMCTVGWHVIYCRDGMFPAMDRPIDLHQEAPLRFFPWWWRGSSFFGDVWQFLRSAGKFKSVNRIDHQKSYMNHLWITYKWAIFPAASISITVLWSCWLIPSGRGSWLATRLGEWLMDLNESTSMLRYA